MFKFTPFYGTYLRFRDNPFKCCESGKICQKKPAFQAKKVVLSDFSHFMKLGHLVLT